MYKMEAKDFYYQKFLEFKSTIEVLPIKSVSETEQHLIYYLYNEKRERATDIAKFVGVSEQVIYRIVNKIKRGDKGSER